MSSAPKVSIVTICRNNARDIGRTLASVAAQDWGNLEYVVVDGASTDGTLEKVRALGPRVDRLVSEPDAGIADAMNKGIRLATGEILLHLHAGDAFAGPDVVRRAAEDYAARRWRWAVGGSRWVRDDGTEAGVQHFEAFSYRRLRLLNFIPHQAAFLERSLFGEVGAFDPSYRIAMDYHLWLRLGKVHAPAVLPFLVVEFALGGASSRYAPTLAEERRALAEVPFGGPLWRGFEWTASRLRPAVRAVAPRGLLRRARAALHPAGRHPGT